MMPHEVDLNAILLACEQESERFDEEIRKSLRSNMWQYMGMHAIDLIRVMIGAAVDATSVAATLIVMGGLWFPNSQAGHAIMQHVVWPSEGAYLATACWLVLCGIGLVVRVKRGELSQTYSKKYREAWIRKQAQQDMIKLIEAVLEKHNFLTTESNPISDSV